MNPLTGLALLGDVIGSRASGTVLHILPALPSLTVGTRARSRGRMLFDDEPFPIDAGNDDAVSEAEFLVCDLLVAVGAFVVGADAFGAHCDEW